LKFEEERWKVPAMEKDSYPMSLRLSPELHRRLEECAARLKIKRHTLAQSALEAAIEAIEKNQYRLSLPMQFQFARESEPQTGQYPQAQEELSRVEERGPAYTVKRGKKG
jgi:predicted DNA-binding protein